VFSNRKSRLIILSITEFTLRRWRCPLKASVAAGKIDFIREAVGKCEKTTRSFVANTVQRAGETVATDINGSYILPSFNIW